MRTVLTKKPIANYLMVKDYMPSPSPLRKTRQGCQLLLVPSNITLKVLASATRQENEIKGKQENMN